MALEGVFYKEVVIDRRDHLNFVFIISMYKYIDLSIGELYSSQSGTGGCGTGLNLTGRSD